MHEGTKVKLTIPAREAAEALSVSERTLWANTVPRGTLLAVRIGRRVLYDPQDLKAWIDAKKQSTAA